MSNDETPVEQARELIRLADEARRILLEPDAVGDFDEALKTYDAYRMTHGESIARALVAAEERLFRQARALEVLRTKWEIAEKQSWSPTLKEMARHAIAEADRILKGQTDGNA
jgi:hypothetical protein